MIDLVLASRSPRRADLLRAAGLRIDIRPADCDETPHSQEMAVAYALRIARAKLDTALAKYAPRVPTLAADTVVWSPTTARPRGKPKSKAQARQMLRELLDGDHFVTTAWALARPPAPTIVTQQTTRVWMRALDDAQLETYLETDEWIDKAGGYGIQGRAAGWVVRIEGSYTNVVGLPLAQVLDALTSDPEPAR